ncbi:MAG: NAD-dependent epimerase/dehydratase, partial [Rhodospirillales bacterium]|nr:NAD-dependent epimerase/dehydratase [Rhodospirillales bacterium]
YAEEGPINIGFGADVTINELATLVARTVEWQGRFVNDLDKPDGTPRKLLDSTKLATLGWRATTTLEDGVRSAYQWYRENVAQ